MVQFTKTEGPDGETIDLVPWAHENRSRLVLKPNDELGGRGVVIGASVEDLTQVEGISRKLAEKIYRELHAA
jgi:ERCC4-type nuclease